MEAPHQLRTAADRENEITITQQEYDDETIIAVDFGSAVHVSVDVVGDTAIVVAGDEQYEFEVPDEATDIITNDGMLTIKA